MLRDFKFLNRNTGKNSNVDEIENVPVNPRDVLGPPISSDSSRPPLNERTRNLLSDQDQEASSVKGTTKFDRTPTKPKARYSDSTMPLRTPEKQGLMSKPRFGWAQKSESSTVDSREEGRAASNVNTPRSTRGIGRGSSECNSTQSTPTKSVNKPSNSGFYLTSGSRPPVNGGARMPNFTALSRGIPSSCNSSNVVNTVEVQHFELKEDPSFWMEHNVQVLIRVRPLNNMEKSSYGYSRCLKQETAQSITWIGQPETRFTFDHVACETIDQETLFRMVGLPMVENCLSGYNSCMFAYGQTGSGKTYTMLGEIEELEVRPSPNRGMTPRIFEFLFARIRAEEEIRRDERLKYNCKCSFLEIYNEQITDLLDPSSTNLMLREDTKKGVYVENLSEFEVQTVGDILQLLSEGSSNRKVAATNMNRESSRSHSVFTCVIESTWEKDSTTNFRFARLNLVDLAGSERQKTSGAEGERLKEAASINKSLSTLGHVIMVLVDVAHGRPRHVPYRDSRLTFLLQDSLGGNSKTMIIANVSPSICSATETLNTLKFAQRAKLIQNNAIINEDSSGDVIALQHQIQMLKEELSALKRERVSRSLSFGPTVNRNARKEDDFGHAQRVPELDHQKNILGEESTDILRVSSKQLKSLETTLAGALRREQMADLRAKELAAEIEQLNRLVSQREDDAMCTKMTLKFREHKIQRMESLLGGLTSADKYLLEENSALSEEIQLLQGRIDKNPEVTRFAHENIKLLEQVRRFQDFYEEGEREMLLAEISELRNQLLPLLDGNAHQPTPMESSGKSHDTVHVGSESDFLQKELAKTLSELEESRNKLNCCLEENEKLRRAIEEVNGSMHVMNFASREQDCDAEVIKESIVEVPGSNHETVVAMQTERGEKTYGNHLKHGDDIIDLQLELDILKVILKEEKSCRSEAEEMMQSLNRELLSSKEMVLSVNRHAENVQEDLKQAKALIEALETQQILSINEIEDLRNSNIHKDELLHNQEIEISSLKEQIHSRESINLSSIKNLESQSSPLEAKLKKMHSSLEKAKRLNQWYQNDTSCASNEEEMDEVRKQVEGEMAEVIVCLQEELSVLQQEVEDSHAKEMENRNKIVLLQTEMKDLEDNLYLRTKDNENLSDMLEDKEKQLRGLSEEWELLTSEIEDILAGGNESLKDASKQLDVISSSFPHKRSWISEQFGRMTNYILEKESLIEDLNFCLKDAMNRRNDMEGMLRSLRGAALVMTEMHQQECSEKDKEILLLKSELNAKTSAIAELKSIIKNAEDQLRKSSSSATAAFVVINRFHELNSIYLNALSDKDVLLREYTEMIYQKDGILFSQGSEIDQARKQNQSLSTELEALEECCTQLRLQLSEEQQHAKVIQMKLEEAEESNILETQKKLVDLKSGVSALSLSMSEYVGEIKDNDEDVAPENSNGISAEKHQTRTGTGEERDTNYIDSSTAEHVRTEISNCSPSAENNNSELVMQQNNVASLSRLKSVKHRDATIILLKKEIESALQSLHGVQAEMVKLQNEKQEVWLSEKSCRDGIKSLMNQLVMLQNAMEEFEAGLELKLTAFDVKLKAVEEYAQKTFSSWFQRKELLEAELGDAKLVASQKAIEASCVLEKFIEAQDTMQEADIMINELMIANKTLKLNLNELKEQGSILTNERDALIAEVQRLLSLNNLKNQQLEEKEKLYESDGEIMSRLLHELEGTVSEVQATAMESRMSITTDFLGMKSQLDESIRSIRESLENVWSEIIVKDCAVSVLHLCHMGILLETATGLNAENGLLQNGLCEQNSLISELHNRNVRSRKELEMCRVLESKLLADLKKGFDRISKKVDDAGDITLKLASFENKIQDLMFQEELMLERSNEMGSELAVLMKDLDLSNENVMASLQDRERLLNEKDEFFEYWEETFMIESVAKDFQLLILSSELKQMAYSKAHSESTWTRLHEVVENVKKTLILQSVNAASYESELLDREIECARLQEEVKSATEKQKEVLSELNRSTLAVSQMETANKALEQDIQSLKDIAPSSNSLKDALNEMMEARNLLSAQVQTLESQCEKLLKDTKRKEVALETSASHASELNQQNMKLLNDIDSLEKESSRLHDELGRKDKELKMMSCLEEENDALLNKLKKVKEEFNVLLQDTDKKKAEFESSLKARSDLEMENCKLRGGISFLEGCIFRLQKKIMKDVDMMQNVDILGREMFELVAEKFEALDDAFQKIVIEVESTSAIMEKIEYLENLTIELSSEILSLEHELSRKDDILKGLQFDFSLLQESASNVKDQKDEIERLLLSVSVLEKDLELKSTELDKAVASGHVLESLLQEKAATISALENDCTKEREIVQSISSKDDELVASVQNVLEAKSLMEKELIERRNMADNLQIEVAEMEIALAQMSKVNESLKSNLDAVTNQREGLYSKILTLTQELEMQRALAEENGAIATEAEEIAEVRKLQAEEKEEEVRLLERSIEELEFTVNVLEQKVDIVKGEAERQRLQREELELELHAVKQLMHNIESSDSDIKRGLEEKEKNLQEARQKIIFLEKEITVRDGEIAQCKAHISELNLHAEAQACEYKQKFKALEAMVGQVKTEAPATNGSNSSSSKLEKNASKSRGSGSPFKCIGLGLVQQIKSERDEELSAGRQRIEELEALAASRQKEIFMLNARLAATESMTHDVIRDLLGVRLNMNSYASLMDDQQLQMLMEKKDQDVETQDMEEVVKLKKQINEFLKERNGWQEEINRRQAEMVATQVSLEKLQQQGRLLTTENELLKVENVKHKKRVTELESEVKKLSGQQNLQQRIHHHVKIKEENNILKSQNVDLSIKLQQTEANLSRLKEELEQFCVKKGRKSYFDDDERLEDKLKKVEEERLQLAQKLVGLCTGILKAAGITKPTSEINIPMAEEALEQLKNSVSCLEIEPHNVKLQIKCEEREQNQDPERGKQETQIAVRLDPSAIPNTNAATGGTNRKRRMSKPPHWLKDFVAP